MISGESIKQGFGYGTSVWAEEEVLVECQAPTSARCNSSPILVVNSHELIFSVIIATNVQCHLFCNKICSCFLFRSYMCTLRDMC